MEKKINDCVAKEQDKDIKWLCGDCECNEWYDCGECTRYSTNNN